MVNHAMPRKLWEHGNIQSTEMYKFMQAVNARHGTQLETFTEFYEYSTGNRTAFYAQLFDWANIIHEGFYSSVVDEAAPIDSVPRWFSGVRLNWAENILCSRGASDAQDHDGVSGKEDDKDLPSQRLWEGNTEKRNVSWRELRRDAARLATALAARGAARGRPHRRHRRQLVQHLACLLGYNMAWCSFYGLVYRHGTWRNLAKSRPDQAQVCLLRRRNCV